MSNADKIIDGLIASSDLSKKLMHPGPDIKPCIAQMLENSYAKGDVPDRNTVALIISSELRRLGCTEDEILRRIAIWNERNADPLKISEYTKAVRSAFRKDYDYSCYHIYLEPTCIGYNDCPYPERVLSKKKYYNNRLFFRYRWPEILPGVANSIYFMALVELERIRQVGAGGLIFASYRDISKLSGANRTSIKKNLEILKTHGLIKLKIGTPRKWERKATEIKRIIPIPKPSLELLRRLNDENPSTEM